MALPVLVTVVALALLAASCGGSSTPSIHDAYVIAPAGDTATMYFTIDNPTAEPVSLVSVSTPITGEVEMQTITESGGLMSMTQLPEIDVEARSKVSLDPSGTHVMLMNVGTLKQGDCVPTTFRFNDGQTVSVSVPVTSGAVPGGS